MFHSSSKILVTEEKVEQIQYRDPEEDKIQIALSNSDPQTAEEHFDRARGLTFLDGEYAAEAAYHFNKAAALAMAFC